MIKEFKEEIALKKQRATAEDYYDIAQCYDRINHYGNPNPFFNNYRRLYYYLKSGLMGYGEGFNNLGFIVEHELDVKNGRKRAKEYYHLAAILGSELGIENYELSKNENPS